MTGNALNHLGNLVISQVIHRVNFDAGTLHPLLICDLANVRINLVDGQTWTGFKVSGVLNLHRPLITSGKFNVIQGFGSICRVGIIDQAPELNRLVNL